MKKIIFQAFSLLFFSSTFFVFFPNFNPALSQELKPSQNIEKYVPNEVIVRYKKDNTPGAIQKDVLEKKAKLDSFSNQSGILEERSSAILDLKIKEDRLNAVNKTKSDVGVVKTKNIFSTDKFAGSNIQAQNLQKTSESSEFILYELNGKKSVEQTVDTFKSLPEVAYAEPNYYLYAQNTVPNDTDYPKLWALKKIEMEKAWDITKGNNSVVVAVIDSGVGYDNEDFVGRTFVKGYNFVVGECIKYDENYQCLQKREVRDTDPRDEKGHGTHVAGTIGAVVNNNKGVAGIAWNVSIMALRVLDNTGQGSISDISDAIRYAADNGAKVINMSIGGQASCNPQGIEQTSINYAYNKGLTIIVAAGNENIDVVNSSPANCQNIIAVAATGPDDERASYSNFGTGIDLAAPGGNSSKSNNDCNNNTCILSTYCLYTRAFGYNECHYVAYEGTSMAAPHVAGVAALMLSINPNLTPSQIKTILKQNTDPFPQSPDHPIGTGRLNAFKTLQALGGGPATNTPTPLCTSHLNGDANGDLKATLSDFEFWRKKDTKANFNCSGTVDLEDFRIWKENFQL